jgi:HlyD family secretion protein
MIGLADEVIRAKRKTTIRWAAGIFTGCLLLLTFFSNTYQQMTLPKVSVEKPQFSQLSYEIEGNGVIRPKRTVSLYDQSGWGVKEVLIQEGDAVKAGQALIVYDSTTAVKNLADEQDRFAKQQLELEKLQEALKQSAFGGEDSKMEDIKRQISSLKLDISIQARKIDSIKKEIADKSTMTAPFDGLISDLQADVGLPSSPGKAAIQISDLSEGWELETKVDADAAGRLVTGETIDVKIKEAETRFVKAQVASIEEVDSGGSQGQSGGTSEIKLVTLSINDLKLTGGEQGEFRLTRKVGKPQLLVPIAAVKSDSQGEYIFVIDEAKRPLGNEFKATKKYVNTEDADKTNASLNGVMMLEDKILIESSEPISDGDLVRLN